MYYSKCGQCGGISHASGTVECFCQECEHCETFKPPNDMESEDICCDCVESGVWAWHDTGWDNEMFELQGVFDSGSGNEEDTTEILQKIELLQSTLKVVHQRLTKGITAR
tara:strand:+ start:104 stop:433 length:330 start_codon:yes stop_codon:yes gene_type:complete